MRWLVRHFSVILFTIIRQQYYPSQIPVFAERRIILPTIILPSSIPRRCQTMLQCPNCGETLMSTEVGTEVAFEYFRGAWSTWQDLFQQAAQFASQVGPGRVISVSHSEDHNDGVITVWYWK